MIIIIIKHGIKGYNNVVQYLHNVDIKLGPRTQDDLDKNLLFHGNKTKSSTMLREIAPHKKAIKPVN